MRALLNRQLAEVAVAKIVPALAGVGFIAIAARLCAPADYGQFALAFATANLVAVIASVWLYQSVLRYAGSGLGTGRLSGISAVALLCTALVCAGQWGLAQWQAPHQTGAAWAIPLLAVALTLNMIAGGFATATQHFREFRVAEVGRGLLLLASAALAGWSGSGAAGLVLAYGIGTALPSVLLLAHLRWAAPVQAPGQLPALLPLLRRFMTYGWPMTLWAALQASQALLERKVLGNHLDAEVFGRFLAASDMLTRGVGLALMPVVTVTHARLMASAGQHTQLDEAGVRLLKHSLGLVLAGGVILTVLATVLRPALAALVPAMREMDLLTFLLSCLAAVLWAVALLAHKPLEIKNQTLKMSGLLALATLTQGALLTSLVTTLGLKTMPTASCISALLYITACRLSSRGSKRPWY